MLSLHLANAPAGGNTKQIRLCWVENTVSPMADSAESHLLLIVLVLILEKKEGHHTPNVHK